MPKLTAEKMKENKAAIVNVASKLFYEHGYNRTSVNDIIAQAGISKGKFYTYFETKEDLIFEIINSNDVTIKQSDTVSEMLSHYIRYRLRRFADEKNRIMAKFTTEFWSSIHISETQENVLNQRYEMFQNDIRKIVEFGCEIGCYKELDTLEDYIHVLMATIDGLIFLDSVMNNRISEAQIEMAIAVFEGHIRRN